MTKKENETSGPLMRAISEGKPPALIKEWEENLVNKGDLILLNAGAIQMNKDEKAAGWYSCWESSSDDGGIGFLDDIAPDLWESVLNAISHRQRFEILRILLIKDKCSSQQLASSLQLRGGALYHHIRELSHTGLIEQKQKQYTLTSFGLQVVLVIGGLIKKTGFDKQGKLQTDSWLQKDI